MWVTEKCLWMVAVMLASAGTALIMNLANLPSKYKISGYSIAICNHKSRQYDLSLKFCHWQILFWNSKQFIVNKAKKRPSSIRIASNQSWKDPYLAVYEFWLFEKKRDIQGTTIKVQKTKVLENKIHCITWTETTKY